MTADTITEPLKTKREFHKEESSTYWLPKDAEEHDRLTGQHFAFKELLKGNISSSVSETLDFKRGISILDVGCGSGAWLADMSTDYPQCTYYGCDIIDVPEIIRKLPKVKYAHGNVVQRLPYEDNTFDFVHMRFFVFALRVEEWPLAVNEVLRVLKPGGLAQFVEGTTKAPKDTNSFSYKTVTAANRFGSERRQDVDIAYTLEKIVSDTGKAKVLQSYHTLHNTSDGTLLAKKFIWDIKKGTESMIKYLGPLLGIEGEEETRDWLDNLEKDMFKNGFQLVVLSLSVQKTVSI
ncbi:S-adenosyl-L-methionine-dependent methyltransferase [Sporodiniella umbellata]|nr:S-adenosyl-L-methionine-dependent methyltransferase [Sporodiniella umbellata]